METGKGSGQSLTPAPRIISRYFGGGIWPRLATVFERAARRACPDWTVDLQRTDADSRSSVIGSPMCVANSIKLDAWAAAVDQAVDGESLLLIDTDTVIVRNLDDVWSLDFDLAFTSKPKGSRFPINGGVVFLRLSPATRQFVAAWRQVNENMFRDHRLHDVWRPAYGGLNQSALGELFHNWPDLMADLTVRRLPCQEWNCEDDHWPTVDLATVRILHYKGALQRALTGKGGKEPYMRPLLEYWHVLELEAQRDRLAAVVDSAPPPALEAPGPPPLADTMIRPDDLTPPADPVASSSRPGRRGRRKRSDDRAPEAPPVLEERRTV